MIKTMNKASIWMPMAAAMAATVILAGSAQAQHRSGLHRAALGKFAVHKIDHRRHGEFDRRHRKAHKRAHRSARRHARRARHVDYGHHRRVKKIIVVEPRRRYRNVWVNRRHGHRYRGYGHHHRDYSAYHWLAFTAITLGALDYMTTSQQRVHESAQITATEAPIGQAIRWNDNGVRGSVTATRDGTSSSGRYCREFRQAVSIGGKVEESYGTACRQPDGAWEIIPTGN